MKLSKVIVIYRKKNRQNSKRQQRVLYLDNVVKNKSIVYNRTSEDNKKREREEKIIKIKEEREGGE